jgi:hypothetical protein
LGFVVMGLAVGSATVWRPADHISASHQVGGGTTALLADPGVMEAQADSVTITIEATKPVVVAVGRDSDVDAWVGDSPVEHLTGFINRERFKVTEAGSGERLGAAAGSDLWVVSRQFDRGGELRWDRRDQGRWMLVVAPADDAEGTGSLEGVSLTMTWPQVVTTPWLAPGLVLGLALAGGGGTYLAMAFIRGRRGTLAAIPKATAAEVASPEVSAEDKQLVPAAAGMAAVGAPGVGGATDQPETFSPGGASPVAGQGPADEAATTPPLTGTGEPEAVGEPDLVPELPAPRKRSLFRRRAKAVYEVPMAPPPPAPVVEPKLDLGLATPNRNWERLAAPQLHYPQDGDTGDIPLPGADHSDQDASPADRKFSLADRIPPAATPARPLVDSEAGPWPGSSLGADAQREPRFGQAPAWTSDAAAGASGSSEATPADSPAGADRADAAGSTPSQELTSPAAPAAPTPSGTVLAPSGSVAPAAPWTGSAPSPAGDAPVPLPAPAAPAAPIVPAAPASQQPGTRPITAAEKIAALRDARSSMADEAAATIAAAQAAAAGVGSAAGLTRRQIREAERAAAEALHAGVRQTGEIPPWEELPPAPKPQVQMQTGEGETK